MSTSMAQLDKSTAVVFATSSFSRGQEGGNISSLYMDGVFKLFEAVTRINKRVRISRAFKDLVRFNRRRKSKSKHQMMSLVADKENVRPLQ